MNTGDRRRPAAGLQTSSLRLYWAGHGAVWFGDDHSLVISSGLDPDRFLQQDWVLHAPLVRLPACVCSAALAVRLYGNRQRLGGVGRIQLSNQLITSQSAAGTLAAMWACEASGEAWLDMREADYWAYALAATGVDGDDRRAMLLLPKHPAWPALSFVRSLRPDMACDVLRDILDIRLFRHTERPGRWNRLFAFMGASNWRQFEQLHLEDPAATSLPSLRALSALRAWADVTAEATREPGDFLLRIMATSHKAGLARSVWKATRVFLHFVAEVWQAGRTPKSTFEPAMFFRRREEVEAYTQHCQRLPVVCER